MNQQPLDYLYQILSFNKKTLLGSTHKGKYENILKNYSDNN